MQVFACGGHLMKLIRNGPSLLNSPLPTIEVETWEQAKWEGWTVTTDIRWSSNGKPVFLCPECSGLEQGDGRAE